MPAPCFVIMYFVFDGGDCVRYEAESGFYGEGESGHMKFPLPGCWADRCLVAAKGDQCSHGRDSHL
jgi:hypothetical protein